MRPLLLSLALLSGCATLIDEHQPPPKDWPDLMILDNVVSGWEVQKRCYQYLSLPFKLIGGLAMACAQVNFEERTCNIYRAEDASANIIEHEQMHCRGLSHPGDTWAEDALRNWQAYLAGQAVAKVAR